MKEYGLAIADFDKCLELEPTNAHYYLGRGNVYRQIGEDKLAIADFEKCIELAQRPEDILRAEQELKELRG